MIRGSQAFGARPAAAASALLLAACGPVSDDPVPVQVADDRPQGVLFPNLPDDMVAAPGTPTGQMAADFTAVERGGYKLGAQLSADAETATSSAEDNRSDGCGSIL